MEKENHLFWQMGDSKGFLVNATAPTNQSIPVNFNHHASKTTEFNHQDNMSESCGSNGFPNVEGRKQKTNKRRTRQEFEEDPDEALSTTQHSVATWQQSYKMNLFKKNRNKYVAGSSKETVPDSQQMWETQKLYIGSSQCQDSIPDFQPMWQTEDQFQERYETAPDSHVVLETQYLEPCEWSPNDQFLETCVNSEILPYVGTKVANRVEVVDPDSQRFVDSRAKDDNLERPIVRLIVEAALMYKDKLSQTACTEMEGLYLAKKMKFSKMEGKKGLKVEGEEVMHVLNLLRDKFKSYCYTMQQGVTGLTFNFDTGIITKGDRHVNNKNALMDSMATMHKHAILYFYSLKTIFPDIWQRYHKSKQMRQKSNSSKRLKSMGGASSSGKRMSTSDTSKSIKKPKVSFSVFSAREELPRHLNPLIDRIRTIFVEKDHVTMDIINKLLMIFSTNKYLFNEFMSYDDHLFREKMILLKRTNLDEP